MSGYDSYFSPVVLIAGLTPGVVLDDIVDDILSVTLENEMGAMDKLSIALRNPDMKYMNDRRFRFGMRFLFRFGYPGRLTSRKTMIVKGVIPTFGSGANTIELTAFDEGLDLAQRTKARNWGPLSSSDIAQKIASIFGLRAVVDDSQDGRKSDRIQPASVTFYEYLNTLADQIGFEFQVENGTLFFTRMSMGEPQGRYTYHGSGFTLLKGFRPNIDAARAPSTRHANTASHGRAAESHQTGAHPSDERAAQNQGRFRIGLEDLSTRLIPGDASGETAREVVRPTAETAAATRRAHARAEQTKIEMAANTAAAEFVGDPTIMARSVIDIRGVDHEYVGAWKVTRTVHSLSTEYTTSAQLKRLGKARGSARHTAPGNQRANESGHGGEENSSSGGNRAFRIQTENLSTRLVSTPSGTTGRGAG